MPTAENPLVQAVLTLSHELGREDRKLAILGEGNTSTRASADTFWVKASGGNLSSLAPTHLTECRFSTLLQLLDAPGEPTDATVDDALLASRVDSAAPKPSVEAMFHAWLLTLPGVNFVGHTHPVAVNGILCSAAAESFATQRLFPDEIVCCSSESVLVPYTDPGLKLAQAIRIEVDDYRKRNGVIPRLILLQSHGLIAIGATPNAVLAATLMAVKAAEITLGAASLGGVRYLPSTQVERIAGRMDEHYRQKALGL